MGGRWGTRAIGTLLVAACCYPLAIGLGDEQPWPGFRGPNRTGVSSGGPELSPGELPVSWSRPVPGRGLSSPAVWGGRAWITFCNPQEGLRGIVCFDPASGNERWRATWPLSSHDKHRENSFATATACTDGEVVVASFAGPESHLVFGLAMDGTVRWETDLGPFPSRHGGGSSPMIAGGLVFVPHIPEGPAKVVALDASTGEMQWTCELGECSHASYATPTFRRGVNGDEVIVSSILGIAGLDSFDGRLRWNAPVFEKRTVSSPVLVARSDEQDVVLGTSGSGNRGDRLVALAGDDVLEKRWEVRQRVPYCPSPLVVEGRIFVATDVGVAACFRLEDGAELWAERLATGFRASPVLVAGRVLYLSREGELTAIDPGPEFRKLASWTIDDRFEASPAVARGSLLVRGERRIWGIGQPADDE